MSKLKWHFRDGGTLIALPPIAGELTVRRFTTLTTLVSFIGFGVLGSWSGPGSH